MAVTARETEEETFNSDTTARVDHEQALRASERRYAELLAAVSSYRYTVMIEDQTPVATVHSPGCEAATGYTADEYAADPELWIRMVHPDDRQLVLDHAHAVLRNERVAPIEHRIRHKDGTTRWIRDTIVPHRDRNGTLVRYDGVVEDITERKHAEERLCRTLESAPDAMVLVDRAGRIVAANAQTERAFGYRREELLHQPIEILLPEHLHDVHVVHRTEYLESPTTRLMEDRPGLVARRADGTEFPVEISLSPIESEEETLVVAAVRDVTARKKLEQSLRANLEIQSALASLLELGLAPLTLEEYLQQTLDVLFLIPWLQLESRGAIFLTGQVVGKDGLHLVAARGLPETLTEACHEVPLGHCLCGRVAATGKILFVDCVDERHETRYAGMQPHGHYCVPVKSDDKLLGVLNLYVSHGHRRKQEEEDFLSAVANILAGIIERKQAEHSLRESEERFQLAARGTDAGIWDWDLRTNEVYFSPRWKHMLGYHDREIANEFASWERLVHPDDLECALQTIRDYLAGKTQEYELEHRLRHKNGSYRWILARGAAVRDSDGRPYRMVGSHLDITERKEAQRALLEREGQLIAAQRIQQHILPRRAPSVPGLDLAGALIPAEFAAGDYFDYLWMPDGSLAIVVGDVSGHGFSSAMLMSLTSAHLRSFVEEHADMEEIVRHTNSILCREVEADRFVTFFFGRFDPQTRRLHYINAGHTPGYVLDADGNVKAVLEGNTLPLAIVADTAFPVSGPIPLNTGDTLLLTTDGILESASPEGELFGSGRLLELVRDHRHASAHDIIGQLQQAVAHFSRREAPQDDVTAVVARCVAAAGSAGE